MSLVVLFDLAAATDAQGTMTAIRLATGAGYNHPSAPGLYRGRVMASLDLTRTLAGDGAVARLRYGDVVWQNAGEHDAALGWAFEGHEAVIRIGDDAGEWSGFEIVARAVQGTLKATLDTLILPLFDILDRLDVPLNANRFAGDNALPDGLEGTNEDIGGQTKPLPAGRAFNVTPIYVNTTRLIWQFADDAGVSDIEAAVGIDDGVFDGAVALERGADYGSVAAMAATPPAAGLYRVYRGAEGSFIRLGSIPVNEITCTVVYGAAGERTAAQTIRRYALRAPWMRGSLVDAGDLAALDAAQPNPVGYWPASGETVLAAIGRVAAGCGARVGFDRLGSLRMRRWDAPSGAPAATFRFFEPGTAARASDFAILSLLPASSAEVDAPASEIELRWYPNWTTQRVSLDAAVPEARRAAVAGEWRRATVPAAPAARYPAARPLAIDSYLMAGGDDEAARLAALRSAGHAPWRLVTDLTPRLIGAVDTFDVVEVILDRFGFAAGALMRVEEIRYRWATMTAELLLWR